MNKTLVIMAAGMGSRYGGLKQIEPVGPDGSLIIDYSIYDARRAGFNKVVFVIKKEIEEDFNNAIGDRIKNQIAVEYVYQELKDIPAGFSVPEGRKKPWGTGQAILACRKTVNEPFLVINADDFYGKESFSLTADWIEREKPGDTKPYSFALAGYVLKNTLTENGTVARGVCRADENGFLTDITERTKIKRNNGQTQFTEDGISWTDVDENACVSMNMWCFPAVMPREIEPRFRKFLAEEVPGKPETSEFLLPTIVNELLEERVCTVKVIPTAESWHGVTYKPDLRSVIEAVAAKIKSGEYPENLWK